MRFAAFDLEIAKQTPTDAGDLMAYAPLGITCAAVATSNAPVRFWHGESQLSRVEACHLVRDLQALVAAGYILITWNGCAFDFQVLAQESGMHAECGALALAHIDFMLIVTYTKGYRLGLEAALKGAGLAGKAKQVRLRSGEVVAFSGMEAPARWAAGEREAVLAYLEQDVVQLLALGEVIAKKQCLRWTSGRGNPMSIQLRTIPTVRECTRIPVPDTSWMAAPPARAEFVAWIG
jgi:hypothetical protein